MEIFLKVIWNLNVFFLVFIINRGIRTAQIAAHKFWFSSLYEFIFSSTIMAVVMQHFGLYFTPCPSVPFLINPGGTLINESTMNLQKSHYKLSAELSKRIRIICRLFGFMIIIWCWLPIRSGKTVFQIGNCFDIVNCVLE